MQDNEGISLEELKKAVKDIVPAMTGLFCILHTHILHCLVARSRA